MKPRRKYFADTLVTLQFFCIGYMVWENGLWSISVAGKVIQAGAAILLLWAVWAMKIRHLRISPIVKESAELAITGPYRYIRHPMYSSVLGYTLPLVFNHWLVSGILISVLLIVVLLIKLRFEEMLLREKFPDYQQYQKETWRIVPFIW